MGETLMIQRILFGVVIVCIGACTALTNMKDVGTHTAFQQSVLSLEHRIHTLEREHRAELRARQDLLEMMKSKKLYECGTFSKKVFSNKLFVRYDDGRASKEVLEYDDPSQEPALGNKVAVTRTARGTLLVFVSPELCT